jgi:hypothetical protein
VNSITFFPKDYAVSELAGHGVGCEYDTRCLIRFTVQDVNGTMQGASYRFSLPDQPSGGGNFVGTCCVGIGPDGGLVYRQHLGQRLAGRHKHGDYRTDGSGKEECLMGSVKFEQRHRDLRSRSFIRSQPVKRPMLTTGVCRVTPDPGAAAMRHRTQIDIRLFLQH